MDGKNIFFWAVFNIKYPRLIKRQTELQKTYMKVSLSLIIQDKRPELDHFFLFFRDKKSPEFSSIYSVPRHQTSVT